MPVSVIISSIKFYNEYKNGVGFASNPGDFTLNLAASIMENVRAVYEIDINWNASVTAGDPWSADVVLGKISRASGNWYNDGFSIGDVCDWLQNGIQTANITITSISQDGRLFYYTLNSGSITDTNSASLVGLTPLTGLINGFGLLGNSENFNIQSKVSGNDQAYYGNNIGFDTGGGVRDTNFVTLSRLGQYEDWRTGEMKARFVSNPAYDIQRFEIQHDFMVVPYYLDGELTNLQNNVIPSLLNGLNSLKYAFNAEFLSTLNNPNTAKSKQITNQQGSVAWFNENFNGFNNEYEITSVSYQEQATLSAASGILIGSKTRVSVDMKAKNRNFVLGDKFGVYVSYVPEQSEYTNTTLSDLKDNFIYDNAFEISGASAGVGQDFIKLMGVFAPSGTGDTITLFFDVEYSSLQKAFLAGKNANAPAYFLIGIQIGDNSLSSQLADRATLLAAVNVYDESPDIPDLMDVTKLDIYPHDQQIGIGAGSSDMVSWNEDGLVIDYEFSLDLAKSAKINSLDFKLIAYKPTTGQLFELDSFSYGVSQAIISGGVQQLIENTTRNYILKSGDQFNDVTLATGALVGTDQFYSGRFAQKISWQDWIENLNVDPIFFNAAEPQNNRNYKASNYSLLNGYEIRLAITANLDGVSTLNVAGNTDYLFLSPIITVYDYEKDGLPMPIWSCVIETFNAANLAPLNGAILTGQDTLFRVTWTNIGGPVGSLAGIWGINRIEETGQLGYDITEMSSLNLPKPIGNQLLKPSVGTLLDMTLVGGNVVMECLIDGSLISSGVNYNLSSRIHDTNFVAVGKQKSPSGDLKQKGDNTVKLPSP